MLPSVLRLHLYLKKCYTLSFFFTILQKCNALFPTPSISLYLQLTHYFGKVAVLSKFHTSSRILSLDPLLPIISNSTSRCWKSSFIEEARFEGPGVPLWAIFKQQSAKYFNPSCPRPQNNLNSTKSISRRISRFLEIMSHLLKFLPPWSPSCPCSPPWPGLTRAWRTQICLSIFGGL